jgi:purine-binding chemotaxis protein CheW
MSLYSTFYLGNTLFGIESSQVQEVSKIQTISPVPLAPPYVLGLINLRGQIAPAIQLSTIFQNEEANLPLELKTEYMSIVCQIDGQLLSFVVDQISDVLEIDPSQLEPTPIHVSKSLSRYLLGVVQKQNELLCVVQLKEVMTELNQKFNLEKI